MSRWTGGQPTILEFSLLVLIKVQLNYFKLSNYFCNSSAESVKGSSISFQTDVA